MITAIYIFINTLPTVMTYTVAPGSHLAPGSGVNVTQCTVSRIQMDAAGNIKIWCGDK